MAPFGLSRRQSGWGQSASGGGSGAKSALSTSIVLLILGVVVGFGTASIFGDSEEQARIVGAERLIGYSVTDMATAEKTDDGAAKAATALVMGLPNLAVVEPDQANAVLADTVTADAVAARTVLSGFVTATRTRLLGQERSLAAAGAGAKVLVVPASYRVRTVDENNVTVQIWRLTVFLESTGAVAESAWTTDDIGLRWEGDRWRISSYDQRNGPSPQLYTETGEFSNYADVQAVLNNSYAFHPSLAGP